MKVCSFALMRALPHAGLMLALAGLAGLLVARLRFRAKARTSLAVGLCTAMTVSMLLFAGLLPEKLSFEPPSNTGPGNVSWESICENVDRRPLTWASLA